MTPPPTEQHFHISSDYVGQGGLGDIEMSLKGGDEPDNMSLGGKALGPGSKIKTAKPRRAE